MRSGVWVRRGAFLSGYFYSNFLNLSFFQDERTLLLPQSGRSNTSGIPTWLGLSAFGGSEISTQIYTDTACKFNEKLRHSG